MEAANVTKRNSKLTALRKQVCVHEVLTYCFQRADALSKQQALTRIYNTIIQSSVTHSLIQGLQNHIPTEAEVTDFLHDLENLNISCEFLNLMVMTII